MMDLEMNCSEQGGLVLITHNELISIHSATSLPEVLLCDHLQQSVTQIPEDLMSPFGFCNITHLWSALTRAHTHSYNLVTLKIAETCITKPKYFRETPCNVTRETDLKVWQFCFSGKVLVVFFVTVTKHPTEAT